MAATAENPAAESDRLAAVVNAYLAAIREEQQAHAHRGHVGIAVRGDLEALAHELRGSLQGPRRSPVSEVARRLRLLAEVNARLHSIAEQDVAAGLDALVHIQESMVRLRQCATPQELVESAPRELCRACGFARAMISRVNRSLWVPEVLEILDGGGDPEADAFRDFVERNQIPLASMLLETDLVRRRVPVRVNAPAGDPRTFKPLIEVSRTTSYVAAPIMPADRVIGFFHADRFGQGLDVSTLDRDNIWVFAEHFGLLYERAILVKRLESQRAQLQDALSSAATAIDGFCLADIELARNEEVPDLPPSQWTSRTRLDFLLTAREREVLDLMADGATNTQIAKALVVSEGTIKSHVKRILRKLRVSNRAGAVARYLHLVRLERRMARS